MSATRKNLPEIHTKLFIDGKWKEGSGGKRSVINPATGKELIQVSQGNNNDIIDAIEAAKNAFPIWANMELKERVKILHNIANLIEENTERLALIMTLEQGKTLKESRSEIKLNIENMHWNAEEARRIFGETIPAPNNHKYEIKKQPIGVVGAITPWNYPSNMIIRKIAPAISSGCTVILKPAGNTPLSAIALFEIFEQAGLPDGVVNLVMGSAGEIGKIFSKNKDIRKLTFTGSTEVGQLLYGQSANTLKKLSLELGGHAPFIVFEDAPIEQTVNILVDMKFKNNGQSCTAPNRIFIHDSIKEVFTNKLVEKVKKISVGNGQDEGVDIGALINEDALESIDSQVKDATNKGAKLLLGGNRLNNGNYQNGLFYEPTILDNVTQEMDIFYEETFGPVIPLLSFSDEDKVIEMANDSNYGLASYLFTTSLRKAEKISSALEYGLVGLNNTGISHSETPFGGMKYSGIGRENGTYGIEEFFETKFVHTTYF